MVGPPPPPPMVRLYALFAWTFLISGGAMLVGITAMAAMGEAGALLEQSAAGAVFVGIGLALWKVDRWNSGVPQYVPKLRSVHEVRREYAEGGGDDDDDDDNGSKAAV